MFLCITRDYVCVYILVLCLILHVVISRYHLLSPFTELRTLSVLSSFAPLILLCFDFYLRTFL